MSDERNPYEPPQNEDPLVDAMAYRDYFEEEEEFQSALAVWPVCPECGRRRLTRCPICKTTGNLFPLGDADFWTPETGADPPSNPSDATSCGGSCECGCGHHHGASDESAPAAPPATAYDNQLYWGMPDLRKDPLPQLVDLPSITVKDEMVYGAENPLDAMAGRSAAPASGELKLVTCYVCDEPFTPKFPARCEWCGHLFETGNAPSSSEDGADDSKEDENSSIDEEIIAHYRRLHEDGNAINGRVVLTMTILAALCLGAILYVVWLFR